MEEMVTRASTAALRRIGQRDHRFQNRAARHQAGGARSARYKSKKKVQGSKRVAVEAKMDFGNYEKRILFRRVIAMGMAGMIAGAMMLAPEVTARTRDEDRVVSEIAVDRARVENLQRWVSAGHADWCKDARVVAAEELWRVAADFSGDGFEMNLVSEDLDSKVGIGNRQTFEWAPLDGRAVYRVTVERFAGLKPIAKSADATVWVPTIVEIRTP